MRKVTRDVEYTETAKSRKGKSRGEKKKLLSEPTESRSYRGSFSTSSREEATIQPLSSLPLASCW